MWDEVAHLVVRRAIRNERLDPGRLLLNAKESYLGFEILDGPELTIDTCEAEVGDLVQLAQRAQYCNANLVGRYFGLTQRPQRILDQLPQAGQLVLADWPSLAGLPNAVDDFVAIERLDNSTALHYDELHLLDGGEPSLTRWALTPTTDARPILRRPRVEHFGVGVSTVRAVHSSGSFLDARIVASSSWGQIWG
jgi:hypothetical protein